MQKGETLRTYLHAKGETPATNFTKTNSPEGKKAPLFMVVEERREVIAVSPVPCQAVHHTNASTPTGFEG